MMSQLSFWRHVQMNLHQPGSLLFSKEKELYVNQLTSGRQSSLHFQIKLSLKKHNDYRPVALTPSVMNCLVKLMVWELKSKIQGQLDSHQFAYDNAIPTIILNLVWV